jgi:hypothetical protein
MKCYTARGKDQDDGTIIIARSLSHAAEIFLTHYASTHGGVPDAFEVTKNDLRSVPVLDDLRALVDRHVSGVVDFTDKEGHILRPM